MRNVRLAIVLLLTLAAVFETYRWANFIGDARATQSSVRQLSSELQLDRLSQSLDEITTQRERLLDAERRIAGLHGFLSHDPLAYVSRLTPGLKTQVRAADNVLLAAREGAAVGLLASDVAIAFKNHERQLNSTALESGVEFLASQRATMQLLQERNGHARRLLSETPRSGLVAPLASARRELLRSLAGLDALVRGYEAASGLLPGMLGYDSPRTYVLLPQNDSELFPSGGLISSYAVFTFDRGRVTDMTLEYFGNLYDRWQRTSNREYVRPPEPLKNYLLRETSWALGEAGWYPDFPTTATIARDFLDKGGVRPSEGTIAIDLQFVAAILAVIGPVDVPRFGVTVDSSNLSETVLANTREDTYIPGRQHEAFLSYLAGSLLNRLYSVPKEQWLSLVQVFGTMGREGHLQLNFTDARLQALSLEYGFDGGLKSPQTDFLMVADTSVNSTKLNLILEPAVKLDLSFDRDGNLNASLNYTIANPFPAWREGKEPAYVYSLMLDGVYGSYLRLYLHPDARMTRLDLDGRPAGAEQLSREFQHRVIGRFFSVLPGQKAQLRVDYTVKSIARRQQDGSFAYSLYVQKQPGTKALPLEISVSVSAGGITSLALDGNPVPGQTLKTTLNQDRRIQLSYR